MSRPAILNQQILAHTQKERVLVEAVEQARTAILELAKESQIGSYLGVVLEGERLVTHCFACASPGYRGWIWAVTLTRVPRGKVATVCEFELLPGEDALLAPDWVPWAERLRPSDLGPGDVLPKVEEDPRLEAGYEATTETEADKLAQFELGLGRERVLSATGRSQAFARWYAGDSGPDTPLAREAKAACSSCGFLLPLAGQARQLFGVCANEWAPDDGKVVSLDHGCGAHSQTDETNVQARWSEPDMVIDELGVDPLAF